MGEMTAKYVLGMLGFVTLSFGGIALGLYIEDNYPLISNMLDEVAGALLIAGVLGIYQRWKLDKELTQLVIEKVGLKKSIDLTGIEEIQFGWRDLPYGRLFSSVRGNVDVVHARGVTWTSYYNDDLAMLLRTTSVNIRVVLLDPESDEVISAYARQYNNMNPDELRDVIRSMARKWKHIYERSGINDQSRLRIYYHSGTIASALYRFDNEIICSSSRITKAPSGPYEMPSIICKKTGQPNDLFKVYLQEIEDVIKDSRPISFDNITETVDQVTS